MLNDRCIDTSRSPVRAIALVLLAGLLALVAVGAGGLGPNVATASAGSCYRDGHYHYDAAFKRMRPGWICGNDRTTGMYLNASYSTPVAIMDSGQSWFVCWATGDRHMGGNNIWYRSQGDRQWGSYPWADRWGYIPAVHVHTSVDPQPGMERC